MRKDVRYLNSNEIKNFLLKNESYINIDLPPYIDFTEILRETEKVFISKKNNYKELDDLLDDASNPKHFENVNYQLYHNKDGNLDWRKFELINPVLYLSLVLEIKNKWDVIKTRINQLINKSKIECVSLPVASKSEKKDKAEQILNWWEEIEQKSIEYALEYEYLYHTDISNCYGSLYTHSIVWALNSRIVAKNRYRQKGLIGDRIDYHLQCMSFGQTNGIPQGSVLMDLVAEFVLLYIDACLTLKLKRLYGKSIFGKLNILRYRDDYRIFTNDKNLAELCLKELSQIMIDFGFKLNSSKTQASENIIIGSIKKDKLDWLKIEKEAKTLQKKLLIFYDFLNKNKNCGTSIKYMQELYEDIKKNKVKIPKKDITVIISIVVNIAYENTRTYPVSMAIISLLLERLENNKKKEIIQKINKKFKRLPNTGYLEIWLQRATIKHLENINDINFKEKLCHIVRGDNQINLWEFSWLKNNIQNLSNISIVNREKLENISSTIDNDEFDVFYYTS